jgi:hypothetical protein
MSDPKILHLSYRESPPDSEYKWLYVNVVFEVDNEHDVAVCDGYSEEWSRSFLYEVENPEKIHRHFLHCKHKFKPIEGTELSELETIYDPEYDISDKKRSGWSYNQFNILVKAKKPGVYFFREYVEDNAITRGALQLLEELKDKGRNGSRFVPFSTLSRSLLVLNTFWD